MPAEGGAVTDASTAAEHKLAAKHEPLEGYLDLRLGVRGDFSLAAYRDGMTAALRPLASRSAPPAGFDAAWRVEGPTNLGGRVNVLAVDPRDADVAYLGYSRGGLWRTSDRGGSWSPLTDGLPFPTLGAVALDTSDGRLWIGTGDPNISGYFYVGDGVYSSDDDGATWQQRGLAETGIINKLLVDPRNPELVFAAAMGKPFEAGPDRGVYRSEDRGLTWDRILHVDSVTGISDLWFAPDDPGTLYATAWPRQRTLYSSTVRGEQARLWRSVDGGDTWEDLYPRMGYDLPASRLGFAAAESRPGRLYMSVCGNNLRFDSFWMSDDGGDTWSVRTTEADSTFISDFGGFVTPFSSFGWFFGQTRVDPLDPDHVWLLGVRLWESFDAGATWTQDEDSDFDVFVHADKHALEFAADGSLWLGTDGGAYRRTRQGARLWEDIEDIPTNMFYRVADVPRDTTSFAGGMQDNGTAAGGADVFGAAPWVDLFGGDGFQPVYAVEDSSSMLAETQNGRVWWIDLENFFYGEITPPHGDERKSWDMPIASRYDPGFGYTRLLTGSNVAYEGEYGQFPDWQRGEPGLLTSDADNRYLVVTAAHIASDFTRWIGTSEGWLWRLREGERVWQRVATGFTERYVTDITSNEANPDAVYVSLSEYRNGDTSPYLLRSGDAGETWASLQGDLPRVAVNSVLSIPDTRDSLIAVATDAGVYASVDRGVTYHRLGTGMTNVPVLDLSYDSLSLRLIAGSFGRSVQTVSLRDVELLGEPPVLDAEAGPNALATTGLSVFPNPATSHIEVRARLKEVDRDATIELRDASGRVVLRRRVAAGALTLRERLDLPAHLPAGTYSVRVRNRHAGHATTFQLVR